MALQHQGEHVSMFICGIADGDGTSNIRGAIGVLTAGINQIQIVHFKASRRTISVIIVTHSPIGTGSGNRIERQITQIIGFSPE